MTFHTTNGTVSDTDTIEHKDIKNPTHGNMNGIKTEWHYPYHPPISPPISIFICSGFLSNVTTIV